MALPSNTTIYTSQMNSELGRPAAQYLTMDDGRVRGLAGRPSGIIYFSDLWGKSSYTPMTLSPYNGYGTSAGSSTSGGTVGAGCGVNVSGGTGGYSYQWTVTGTSGSPSVGTLTGASVNASKTFPKLANGEAHVSLSVVVTDSTGHQASTAAQIDLYWGTQA